MKTKLEKRLRRKVQIKKAMRNSKRPRLCVYKSLNNIYAFPFKLFS